MTSTQLALMNIGDTAVLDDELIVCVPWTRCGECALWYKKLSGGYCKLPGSCRGTTMFKKASAVIGED